MVQLPNVAEFVILYFALQKIGAIPIAALATHRYGEISQFVQIVRTPRRAFYPDAQGDFEFGPMVQRVWQENAVLKCRIVLGGARPGCTL